MKKQKVISAIVSVAAAFGGLGIVPVSAAEVPGAGEGSISLYEGYQFVDIAHNGDTYVAMAKDSSMAGSRLYTSVDGGITWEESLAVSKGTIYGNTGSQNQLVYWDAKDIFVAHFEGNTYRSANGQEWTDSPTLHWTTTVGMAAAGENLVFSGFSGSTAAASTNDLNNRIFADTKISLQYPNGYPIAIAAKPMDESGNIELMATGSQQLYTFSIGETGDPELSSTGAISAAAIPTTVYDIVYAKGGDQFLMMNGNGILFTAKEADSATFNNNITADKINPALAGEAPTDVTVTGVGVNDDYVAVGLSDGTIFYTTNNAEITQSTAWTQIPVPQEAIGEPIKNIEFANATGDDFIALSNTKVIKGNSNSYCDIKNYVSEYRAIGDPYVVQDPGERVDPFTGVNLIGGVYSPTLDTYVLYGTETAATSTEYGEVNLSKIFTSSDGGATWTSQTIDPRHTLANLKNGIVWWESQDMFVISAYNQTNQGVLYTSTDGMSWTPVPTSTTGYVKNTELAVGGSYLYTTNGSKQLYKYSALNTESRENPVLTPMKNEDGVSQELNAACKLSSIAVSDEDDPAIFASGAFFGVVRNNDSTETEEIEKWRQLHDIGNGNIIDSVYSANTDRFIALIVQNFRTTIITKDGARPVQGPVITGGDPPIVMTAVDTNGSDLMFTCENGNLYTAADDANFSTGNNGALVQVQPVNGTEANVMTFTNVFAAGDRFIATASNDTDSKVYVIAKNNSGAYEYADVTAISGSGEFEPGGTVQVKVYVENQEADAFDFTIIAAVFSPDNRCVQIETADKSVAAFTNETATMDVTIDAEVDPNSTMRLFVWDSLEGMVPLTDVSVPFN